MKSYTLTGDFYACACGGRFYVEIGAPVYGVAPCKYHYSCDRCRARKVMSSRSEVRSLALPALPKSK